MILTVISKLIAVSIGSTFLGYGFSMGATPLSRNWLHRMPGLFSRSLVRMALAFVTGLAIALIASLTILPLLLMAVPSSENELVIRYGVLFSMLASILGILAHAIPFLRRRHRDKAHSYPRITKAGQFSSTARTSIIFTIPFLSRDRLRQ